MDWSTIIKRMQSAEPKEGRETNPQKVSPRQGNLPLETPMFFWYRSKVRHLKVEKIRNMEVEPLRPGYKTQSKHYSKYLFTADTQDGYRSFYSAGIRGAYIAYIPSKETVDKDKKAILNGIPKLYDKTLSDNKKGKAR